MTKKTVKDLDGELKLLKGEFEDLKGMFDALTERCRVRKKV